MLDRRRLLLLGLLLAPTMARAQDNGWQTVIAPDLRFRLEMPTPVNRATAEEKEKGHASARTAWSAKRDDEMFDFDFVDYQPEWFSSRDTKEMARDLGRGEAEKAFPREKFKYVRDEPITLQGWDGYALDIEDQSGALVMMRTYIVRDRLYRLLVTAKPDPKSRSAASRFLSSLRLADTRQ
jgi:hypothetical protein